MTASHHRARGILRIAAVALAASRPRRLPEARRRRHHRIDRAPDRADDRGREKRQAIEQLGRQYEAKRGDRAISMSYARLLRETNQIPQAIAVDCRRPPSPIRRRPRDRVGARPGAGGRRTLPGSQRGAPAGAQPRRPNWRVLSTQGAIAISSGSMRRLRSTTAQRSRSRLASPPHVEPRLVYALSNRLPEAEQIIRQAVAHPAATPRMRGQPRPRSRTPGPLPGGRAGSSERPVSGRRRRQHRLRPLDDRQNNTWRQLQGQERTRQGQASAARPRT